MKAHPSTSRPALDPGDGLRERLAADAARLHLQPSPAFRSRLLVRLRSRAREGGELRRMAARPWPRLVAVATVCVLVLFAVRARWGAESTESGAGGALATAPAQRTAHADPVRAIRDVAEDLGTLPLGEVVRADPLEQESAQLLADLDRAVRRLNAALPPFVRRPFGG